CAAVALVVSVRLCRGVDAWPLSGGRRRAALPDVAGPLRDGVGRPSRGLGQLAGTQEYLTGEQERDEDVDRAVEVLVPADQVVLVTSVGVAGRIGVVLEDVDLAADRSEERRVVKERR